MKGSGSIEDYLHEPLEYEPLVRVFQYIDAWEDAGTRCQQEYLGKGQDFLQKQAKQKTVGWWKKQAIHELDEASYNKFCKEQKKWGEVPQALKKAAETSARLDLAHLREINNKIYDRFLVRQYIAIASGKELSDTKIWDQELLNWQKPSANDIRPYIQQIAEIAAKYNQSTKQLARLLKTETIGSNSPKELRAQVQIFNKSINDLSEEPYSQQTVFKTFQVESAARGLQEHYSSLDRKLKEIRLLFDPTDWKVGYDLIAENLGFRQVPRREFVYRKED